LSNRNRCFSEAVALAREADVKGQLPYAECRLAEMDVLQGRPTEAIARLEPRVSEMRWQYEVVLLSVLAEAYADMGDAAKAEEVVDIAQTRARSGESPLGRGLEGVGRGPEIGRPSDYESEGRRFESCRARLGSSCRNESG
jgi:hypothetical protein